MALDQRWIIGDFLTGEYWFDLPVAGDSTWEHNLNSAESIAAKIPVMSPDVADLDIEELAVPWRTFLGVVLNDRVMAAGPIITRSWDHSNSLLTLNASGAAAWLGRRLVLPNGITADTLYDATGRNPNPAANTVYPSGSYRDIIRKLLQQAQSWPYPTPPILYEFLEGGAKTASFLGTDLKSLGEAVDNIIDLDDGIDFELRPSWVGDGRDHVVWVAHGGSVTDPLLSDAGVIEWDLGADNVDLSDLTVSEDASNIATRAWFTGGRSSDVTLFASADSPLLQQGWPLLELVDSSHTSVSDKPTLQKWANNSIKTNNRPVTTCSFSVRGDQPPTAGSYQPGVWVNLIVENVPLLPDGPNQMRLLGMSGQCDSDQIKLTLAPVRSDDAWLP